MTLETGVKALAEAVAVDVKALEDGKVDKELGKGLSTEDYTSLEKTKLAGIQAGAQVNAVTSVSGRTGAVTLAKGDVGLSNVDNTSDINKPISTAASSALSGKVDKVTGKGLSESDYTAAEKTKLAGIATEATKNRADSENADKVHMHPVNQVTGLGTAATANLTTSSTDGTAGRVLKVGDFGIGGNNPRVNSFDANDLLPGQRRSWSESFTEADAVSVNLPALGGNPTAPRSWHVESMGNEPIRVVQYATEAFGTGTVRGRTFVRVRHDTTWHPWQEIIRTSSLLQTTGSSTDFPMSQKAVSDSLDTKASTSTQVIAGTGLSGGGTLAANRTLTVSYGTTAGTAAQGNDSRITGALQTSQVVQATGTSTTNVMSQAVTTGQLDTKAPLSHTHPWSQVTGQPATATRWPTLAEVTGKPANYPTDWATVSDKPIVQTVGTSTTNLMSQKAVSDLFASMQPQLSITGSCTTNGTTDNTLTLTGIVSALALEAGDVIQITGSTDGLNDKLFTVESITDANSIIVNYEHAGNRGNGSLKLADETAAVTITRIAKWYNAPLGLGQAWVIVKSTRTNNTVYSGLVNRAMVVSITNSSTPVMQISSDSITWISIANGAAGFSNNASPIIPAGWYYKSSGWAYPSNEGMELR